MPDNQGSFVTGLTIGLFAGAASYFLLVTPKGKKLRQRLEDEWQAAQAAGVTTPTSQSGPSQVMSVRSLFSSLRQAIAAAAEQAPAAQPVGRPKKPSVKKMPRFKGV